MAKIRSWYTRLFECDLMFRDLLVREPIISIAETVLGEHCHCIAQGCILNRKDLGINRFHIDDGVEFPNHTRNGPARSEAADASVAHVRPNRTHRSGRC